MGRGSAAGQSEDVSFSDLETPKWSFKARQVNQDGWRTSTAGGPNVQVFAKLLSFVGSGSGCSESVTRPGPAS